MALSWSVNASTLGLGFKLQSQRAPWDTEARVDAFLCAFRARLAALAPDALATQKRGLVAKMCERAKSVGEETARFWARVRAGDCDFLRGVCSLPSPFPPHPLPLYLAFCARVVILTCLG